MKKVDNRCSRRYFSTFPAVPDILWDRWNQEHSKMNYHQLDFEIC